MSAHVRAELGTRTIFNLLGPLANPAGTKFQIIGVFAQGMGRADCAGARAARAERAWVVHGSDGLDELTTTGVSDVAVLDGGKVSTFRISPRNAGLPDARPEDLAGGDAAENAAHIRAVLGGAKGAYRDIVLLNAACCAARRGQGRRRCAMAWPWQLSRSTAARRRRARGAGAAEPW